MPTGRIRPDSATARLRNTDVPTVRVRYSPVLTPGTDTLIRAGEPFGPWIWLTYAWDTIVSTPATFKGEVPTAKIRND